jgi:cell division protein FtsI (penicillin-binding protein 3)
MKTQDHIPQQEKQSAGQMLRRRLKLLQIGLLAFFAVVCCRLIQIQVINANDLKTKAENQYRTRIDLPAARGTLYDRDGNILASNTMFVSFAADPKVASEDARAIAAKFSQLFGKPRQYYTEKLNSESRFVWLERQVNGAYAKRIDRKKLGGLVFRNEPKRLYYQDRLAGQLIGSTNLDNKGMAGLELMFDKQLRGEDGYVILQRDGRGNARPSVDYPRVDPTNGHNITLTIDMWLQSIAEKELKRGVDANKAEGGLVVMMQPRTGEVLALAQYPTVDPNHFGNSKPEDQKLRAVTDMFEPGSVFKVVTASAAFENNLISPDKQFYAENGTYVVPIGGGKTRKIIDTHKEQWITFREAMEVSSNIVMAKASDIIGSERLYRMARDYGFGTLTDVGYPGEVKGLLKKPVEWSVTSLNSIAFGYETGVTPIQIAAAYSAVANGGILMKPYLLKKETDASDSVIAEMQPQQIRRVVSEGTAKLLTSLFEGVVQRGTAKMARIDGIRIAGKTGTSRKIVDGKYSATDHTASFVGFFPVEDPQILCLVMMDIPGASMYTGGTTSAPVFRAIAEQVITSTEYVAPAAPAGDSLKNRTVMADNRQQAAASAKKAVPRPVRPEFNGPVVPDVKGCSLRKAIGILTAEKYRPEVRGTGVVTSQDPAPGQPAKAGMRVVLTCQPMVPPPLGAN